MQESHPCVLTVAGSDSGGGAGIQTDLRTFNAFRVYGCSAITAVTGQNPDEVRRVDVLPPEAVRTQLDCVLDAYPVRFAKTGMLANEKIIECVAEFAVKYNLQLVVDPVMVSTSGATLLQKSAVAAMRDLLLPQAMWITPNLPEAELLCKSTLSTPAMMAQAALQLFKQYKCNVLLKSGHAITGKQVTDIVCYQGQLFALSSPAVDVCGNTAHGTGCTLSAAITASLAWDQSWQEALKAAKAFVFGALTESVTLSDKVKQMYPPVKNYADKITLEPL